jgi:hypothetical protein
VGANDVAALVANAVAAAGAVEVADNADAAAAEDWEENAVNDDFVVANLEFGNLPLRFDAALLDRDSRPEGGEWSEPKTNPSQLN